MSWNAEYERAAILLREAATILSAGALPSSSASSSVTATLSSSPSVLTNPSSTSPSVVTLLSTRPSVTSPLSTSQHVSHFCAHIILSLPDSTYFPMIRRMIRVCAQECHSLVFVRIHNRKFGGIRKSGM